MLEGSKNGWKRQKKTGHKEWIKKIEGKRTFVETELMNVWAIL